MGSGEDEGIQTSVGYFVMCVGHAVGHNIIQIHNSVLWIDNIPHIFLDIFTFSLNAGNIMEYFVEYYQSHITLL